ncbi:alpha/beta fold hydrolase [Vibrio chagasii]|nr:alpha/beta fold hydrolase [Vibrio chagasii]
MIGVHTYPFLEDFPRLCIDLPGHGQSRFIDPVGLNTALHQDRSVHHFSVGGERSSCRLSIVVIGYSMGGRLAMYGVTRSPCFETLSRKSSSKVATLAWSVMKKSTKG